MTVRRRWVSAIVLLGALGGCGTASVVGGAGALLFGSGAMRASITIDAMSATPTFSGTIGSSPLTGRLSAQSQSANSLCSGTAVGEQLDFTYEGSYAGTAYSFSGCTYVATSLVLGQQPRPGSVQFRVRGQIGSEAIIGEATYGGTTGTPIQSCVYTNTCSATLTFPFTGSVGSQAIKGTATLRVGPSSHLLLTATLTVT